MSAFDETRDQTERARTPSVAPTPGAVLVLEAGKPTRRAFVLPRGGLALGRGQPEGTFDTDDRVSRRHVVLHHARGAWAIEDLGSRNGTFVNGQRIEGYFECDRAVLVRLGRSLVWTVPDVEPYLAVQASARPEGSVVVGGRLAQAWREIERAARAGQTLLLRGESGTGKELAARHMHEACFGAGARAPFIAVNCAAIPEGLAERLLFGARRGAYSGASDAHGYVAAADGGSLFLDEIAELDLPVQAKLLRVLETREVLPLGDARPRPVNIRVCAATHANLRQRVAEGRFRQDLYYRLGRPEVILPSLSERLDELPWLIEAELGRASPPLRACVDLVEACALRPWPGNVRELLGELRTVCRRAEDEGSEVVEARHLSPDAGCAIETQPPAAARAAPADTEIEKRLREHGGNVTRAADSLGMHRNQLRRWLAKRDKPVPT
jgi:transcriptional regulator with PAS, ATPase and Fis domain